MFIIIDLMSSVKSKSNLELITIQLFWFVIHSKQLKAGIYAQIQLIISIVIIF